MPSDSMPSDSMPSDPAPRARAVVSALRTLELERAGLAALAAALDGPLGQALAKAVDLIVAAPGRVIVSGMGKSGHVARKIAATLASTGVPAHYVHPAEASHGDLGMIQTQDVIFALSWSGETPELADLITYAGRFRIPLIGMSSRENSALIRAADLGFVLPAAEEACPNGLAPTTSTTMQMAMGDALAVALLDARGFTAQDFRVFHPGGKLGARLSLVRDVMHRGEALPLVPASARMGEAVLEISTKGFGCVGVVEGGRLVGIVTDGDLRRHMRADLMALPVEAVMTRDPRSIAPDALAAVALDMMTARGARKIMALFVVDGEGAPCGLVHMHDLLRIGVA
jgi:arabinose-5-phosphate isomerase